jgi:uncharacterized protein YndB with AHSA1/START domain
MLQVESTVFVPFDMVWQIWNQPEHIKQWNVVDDSWCCPSAYTDFRSGGSFCYRMEKKDGSFGFDYKGIFNDIKDFEFLSLILDDGRKAEISFIKMDEKTTKIIERFEHEHQNTMDVQKSCCQRVHDNFKAYAEKILVGCRN